YYSLSDLIIWELENGLVKVGAARLIQLIKNELPENKNVFLSKRHNLVLTTNGNATQQNVLNFAEAIQTKVKYFFNINLEIEPRVIS
ncbi:UDP-N-acetylenolpyruvoylglucosamine reductase, partial [Gammaproteobacteria bacterium]|nr:UDP-N-acetylenolpyruvoylglucosamine reductase [Gammaproteobacteria bacterium]